MLKKQTIWLLTMLSLMIVLSAYYLMSDKDDFAYIQTDKDVAQEDGEDKEANMEVEDIEEVESNDIFTMIRMEMDDDRSMKKDRLKEVIGSSSATTEEINEAMEEMESLETMSSKERILQESILSENEGFEEVLVRADSDKVHVDIMTDTLEKKDAAKIMRDVHDEMGQIAVDVKYRTNKD